MPRLWWDGAEVSHHLAVPLPPIPERPRKRKRKGVALLLASQIEDRRYKVLLYIRDHPADPLPYVAAQLGLSYDIVREDHEVLKKRMLARCTAPMEEWRARLLEYYLKIAQEAADGYKRSREPRKRVVTRAKAPGVGATPSAVEQTNTAEEREGDMRWLDVEMKAFAAIERLTGAAAPITINNNIGQADPLRLLIAMDPAVRAARAAEIVEEIRTQQAKPVSGMESDECQP